MAIIPRKIITGAAPVIIIVLIMAFFAVSSVAARSSRRLGGDVWAPAAGESSSVVSGDDDDGVVVQFLRQMYLQRLGAGPSCGTNSANGGCPRRPPRNARTVRESVAADSVGASSTTSADLAAHPGSDSDSSGHAPRGIKVEPLLPKQRRAETKGEQGRKEEGCRRRVVSSERRHPGSE
uniref:Uncharacterized protein n=3 Tax=Zea mays TaxID=4577 RepID=A0A804PW86_MAIZE